MGRGYAKRQPVRSEAGYLEFLETGSELDGQAREYFAEQEEMTGEEKLALVEQQVALAQDGADHLDCPYCLQTIPYGAMFCCVPFALAVNAILDRLATEERMEMAEKIAEAAAKQPTVTIQ